MISKSATPRTDERAKLIQEDCGTNFMRQASMFQDLCWQLERELTLANTAFENLTEMNLKQDRELAAAKEELKETRNAHRRLAVNIKKALGFDMWPKFDGDFQDAVGVFVKLAIKQAEQRLAEVEEGKHIQYTTDACPKHHGMPWTTTVTAYTVYGKVCPLCEDDAAIAQEKK